MISEPPVIEPVDKISETLISQTGVVVVPSDTNTLVVNTQNENSSKKIDDAIKDLDDQFGDSLDKEYCNILGDLNNDDGSLEEDEDLKKEDIMGFLTVLPQLEKVMSSLDDSFSLI